MAEDVWARGCVSLAVAKGEWEHWPARDWVSPFVSLAVVVGVAALVCK